MRNIVLCGALVVALAPRASAAAGPAAAAVTAGQLASLDARIAVLKRELQVAKLRAAVAQAGSGSTARMPGASGDGLSSRRTVSPQQATSDPGEVPEVLSISGAGTHLVAEIALPSGGVVVATPGLRLSRGLTVKRISADGVEVRAGSKVLPLPFASGAGPQEAPPASPRPVVTGMPVSLRPLPPGFVTRAKPR